MRRDRLRRRLGRLRQLDRGEVRLVAQVPLLLPLAAIALRRWGLRRVQERLASLTQRRRGPGAAPEALAAAQRLAWGVEAVARRLPWHVNCLQRSVTLWWLLRRRGVAGDLHIGVRRRSGGLARAQGLDFHAWVEHEGAVLNDVADIRTRFATFDRPITPRNADWR